MKPALCIFTRTRPGRGLGQFTSLRGLDAKGRELWYKRGTQATKTLNLMRGLKVEVRNR